MPLKKVSEFVKASKDFIWLGGIIVAMSGFAASAAFALLWPMFIEKLSTDLNMATKDDIAEITERINDLSGDSKILKIKSGHSFVKEPVHYGEDIVLEIVAARSEKGLNCVFIEATPLFMDDRSIPMPGEIVKPIKQLGLQEERLNIVMQPPGEVNPGRIGVYLSMHYTCPFGADGSMIDQYEETRLVFFVMLDAPVTE